MKLLAIVGSPRKGQATDRLIDKAIEGFLSKNMRSKVTKINLADHTIAHCSNCLVCRDSETTEAMAKCTIRDDMNMVYNELLESDHLLLGTPVHMGYPTGLMMTFLERVCWVFAKPTKKILNINGCPEPRSNKKRRIANIVVSGVVPPVYRRFCDDITKLIKQISSDSLGAKMVADMYAGDIEHRGAERYYEKAYKLGVRLG